MIYISYSVNAHMENKCSPPPKQGCIIAASTNQLLETLQLPSPSLLHVIKFWKVRGRGQQLKE